MEFLGKYQLLELMDRFESNKKVSHSKIIFRYIKPYIVNVINFNLFLKNNTVGFLIYYTKVLDGKSNYIFRTYKL